MQEDERGSRRSSIAPLPVAQRGDRKSEIARKLALREVKASAKRTYVDRPRRLDGGLTRNGEVGPPAIWGFSEFIHDEVGYGHLETQFRLT